MVGDQISDSEYAAFQRLMCDGAGIRLPENKRPLVKSRLAKRLREYGFQSYTEYLDFIAGVENADELQTAIDLLTTNETYFFREPRHFGFIQDCLGYMSEKRGPLRVWSAACSCGQEPYSLAMLLAAQLGSRDWQVVATDISRQVLEKAGRGLYTIEESSNIPREYLEKYCLKGVGEHEGTLLIKKWIRERVQFLHANLNGDLPSLGKFDIILLRNVMIYFNQETKARLVQRMSGMLNSGGYFIIGHSETLNGINPGFSMLSPSIYLKS